MPNKSVRAAVAALFALSCPAAAVGQSEQQSVDLDLSDRQSMEQMVVTATRNPLPRAAVGSSISVITAEDIELRQYQFAFEALRALPGVSVNQNGTFGGQTSVRIRGTDSEQTLVLIDGVVVNDPSTPGAGFNFATLDPNDIERIEVLRGAQSTLYGSDAIGGVVNVITKRGQDAFGASAFAEAGSFATVRGGATVSGAVDAFDYRVSASGLRTDGISAADARDGNTEDDGFDNVTLSGNVGLKLGRHVRLSAFGRYADSENEFDGFSSATGVIDGDRVGRTDELVLRGMAEVSLFDGRFTNSFTAGFSNIERQNFSDGAPSFDADGERLSLEYKGDVRVRDWLVITAGAETEETRILTATTNDDVTIDSVYGLVQVGPVSGLSVSAGIRHDDHETFGGVTSLRFTGAYRVPDTDTVVRASWGEGFKAPTPFQLAFVNFITETNNPDLRPERSDGWDVGVEQNLLDDRLTVQATFFRNEITDLIEFLFDVGGYQNRASVSTEGVELAIGIVPVDWLTVDASYSFVDAVDRQTGERLIRVPKNSASMAVTARPIAGLTVGTDITVNGAEQDSRGTVDGWTRVNLRASYDLFDGVELFGRIENLFDEDYQEVFGFGTPGISGFGGVRVRL